jgi:hypothetical protein
MKHRLLNESDINRIVRRVLTEEEESLMRKLVRKLKGVSDKQLEYNIKNDLPWDWKGSKEGFYDMVEKKHSGSGSN